MSQPVAIIGGGEHARVVVDAARSSDWHVSGFIDRLPCEDTQRLCNLPHLGDDLIHASATSDHFRLVVGVGNVKPSPVRAQIVERYQQSRKEALAWATIVHARAWVSPSATLAPGAVVLAGAIVNAGATLGAHVIVNTGAIIEHDVVLDEFVHASPGAVLGGGVSVGPGSYLGLGCRVRDHVRIGRGVTIGMGAVVVSDVPDGVTVKGVPGKWQP